MNNVVITFARQVGSGGHEVAEKVAKLLDIPYYDKNMIISAGKDYGLSEDAFSRLESKSTNSLLYSLVVSLQNRDVAHFGDEVVANNVFAVQSNIIKKIADSGSCVIIGRCSDYTLKDYDNRVSIFVHAGLDYRTKIIMERYNLKEKAALDFVLKADKRRKSFYDFYTNREWGNPNNYDLSVSTEKLKVDGAAKLIVDYVKNL